VNETIEYAVETATSPLTITITRTVRHSCKDRFEAALHTFLERSLEAPGQLGVLVLRPAPGARIYEYSIVRRFASREARDTFYNSSLFQEWLSTVEPLSVGAPRYEELSGLETWFTLPGQHSIVPPPRWKMALMTAVTVYPASLLVPALLHSINGAWPLGWRVLLNSVGIVVLLTYGVMPLLTRLLRPWLYPRLRN
jgi:antibiotic biosynthesis monooxygenase (ABM) superfamily enzyme